MWTTFALLGLLIGSNISNGIFYTRLLKRYILLQEEYDKLWKRHANYVSYSGKRELQKDNETK